MVHGRRIYLFLAALVCLTINPPHTFAQTSQIDAAIEDKIRSALRFVLVETSQVAPLLDELATSEKLARDLESCGLSFAGPKCLDNLDAFVNHSSLMEINGQLVFHSELRTTSSSLILKFTIDQLDPTVKVSQVEVLKTETPVTTLLNLSVTNDFEVSAWQHLQKPRDLRELYHLSRGILEVTSSPTPSQVRANLAATIERNKNLITQSKDEAYQEHMLTLLLNTIPIKPAVMVEICKGLANSASENVRQITASIMLEAQPEQKALRSLVVQALDNSRWDIRKRAVSALARVAKLTLEEQNLLLARLDDNDEDVRKAATEANKKFSIEAAHFETVKRLAASSRWTARQEAINLMNRTGTPASLNALINQLDDEDTDVRKTVAAALHGKSLDEQYVPALVAVMNSANWWTRHQVALLLGKIPADRATFALIKKMDDPDVDTRKTITQELGKRYLNENHVRALTLQFKSQNRLVRKDVAGFLGKITSLAASNSLIAQMEDDEQEVRNTVIVGLLARPLTVQSLPLLQMKLASPISTVRRDAAKALSKMRRPEAQATLRERLAREEDQEVKKQIRASLKTLSTKA